MGLREWTTRRVLGTSHSIVLLRNAGTVNLKECCPGGDMLLVADQESLEKVHLELTVVIRNSGCSPRWNCPRERRG